MRKKRIWKFVIVLAKIALAVFVIYYLFKSEWLTKDAFTRLFRVEHILFILLSGSFYLITQILCTSRLVLLLRAIHFPLRFFRIFKLVMIGNFFNTIIPGMIGGDFIKSLYLMKGEEGKRGQSAGIVIMDRALGFLALLWIGGVSLIYLLWQKSKVLNSFHNEMYIAIGAIGCISIFFGVLIIFSRNERARRKIASVFTAFFRKGILYNMLDGFGALMKHRLILGYSLLVSVLIQIFSLAGLLILANLVSETLPDMITLAGVSAIVVLVNIIPVTPGNLGWTELIAALCWSAVGSNAGATIFLNWRIVTVMFSLPWGLVFLSMTDWRK